MPFYTVLSSEALASELFRPGATLEADSPEHAAQIANGASHPPDGPFMEIGPFKVFFWETAPQVKYACFVVPPERTNKIFQTRIATN